MNKVDLIDVHANETIRLNAWRSVFERTNRIISGRPVTVRISQPVSGMEDVSGWSDGERIFFNGPMLVKMLKTQGAVESVLRLKGLNYHELSHVLFTPRMSDELPKRVKQRQEDSGDSRWWYSFNALEDQRIESMFTAAYGPSRRYFEAMILEWVLRHGTAECAVLTYGRKYLPARIRVQAGRVFIEKHGQELYDKFKVVIDAYCQLDFPRDSMKGLDCVRQYRELLIEMQNSHNAQLPQLPVGDNGGHDGAQGGRPENGGPMRSGGIDREAAGEAKERAAKQAKQAEEDDADAESKLDAEDDEPDEDDEFDDGGPMDGESDDEDEGDGDAAGKADGEKGGDADGGSSPSGADEGEDADGDGGQDDGQPGGGGAGEGSEEHVVLNEDQLADELRRMIEEVESGMDDILADEALKSDVESILDAVNAEANRNLDRAEGVGAKIEQTLTPLSDSQLAVRRITQILQRIQQEVEPTIVHRQYHGRIDIRRVINRRPEEMDVFRAYDSGSEEEAGLEVVLIMDVSGSMAGNMVAASQAVWILKRSFDRLDIRTTVLVYDTDHQVLYQPIDRAPARIQVVSTGGGTSPNSALEQALLILKQSNRPNRVLVTVTDGQWQGEVAAAEDIVKTMNRLGMVTLLLGLGGAQERYGAHQHLLAHDLNNVRDLTKAVTKIAEAVIRAATGQV